VRGGGGGAGVSERSARAVRLLVAALWREYSQHLGIGEASGGRMTVHLLVCVAGGETIVIVVVAVMAAMITIAGGGGAIRDVVEARRALCGA
jgi:hypothetical protein